MGACSSGGEELLIGKGCVGDETARCATALSADGVGPAGLAAIASTVWLGADTAGAVTAGELPAGCCACGVGGETKALGGDTGRVGGGSDVDEDAAFVVYAKACHCEETHGSQEDEEARPWPLVVAVGVRSC